ncbi:MAG: LysR family transcriptional regulator [Lentisphaeria bacterium]|nr:LysR family transcriptional regulator [Lentisphaeria bacterium]
MSTFHQLKQFLILADVLHFGRAAGKMGISQAALSRTVGKLEEDLGFLLFDREDRHAVRLTEAGQDYARSCRRLLAEFSEAESAARRLAGGDVGDLEIQLAGQAGMCPEVIALLTKVHYSHPGIRLRLSSAGSVKNTLDALSRREIHAGVIPGDLPWPSVEGFVRQEIARYDEKIVLAIPEKHPVLSGQFPHGLQSSHFLIPGAAEKSEVTRFFFNYFTRQFRRAPVIAMEVTDSVCLQNLAAAGGGIGVLPAGDVLPVRGVVWKDLPLTLDRQIWLVSRAEEPSPVLKNLYDCLSRNR